jgi:hypothetical protein
MITNTVPPWSPEEDHELSSAIVHLIDAMRAVWNEPNFSEAIWTFDQSKPVVVTSAEIASDAHRVWRGQPGVTVKVNSKDVKQSKDDVSAWISHAIYSDHGSGLIGYRQGRVQTSEWIKLVDARNNFLQTLLKTAVLNVRMICSVGRRIEKVEVILEHLRDDNIERYSKLLKQDIVAIIADAAERLGIQYGHQLHLVSTEQLSASVRSEFVRLANQEFFEYQAVAFLNGPKLESDSINLLDALTFGATGEYPIEVTSVSLSYTTDELLSHGVSGSPIGAKLPIGTEHSNLAIVIELRIPVRADPDRYYDLYPTCEHIASVVLESIRLVRSEDIGISSIAIRGMADPSPWAPTEEWVYSGSRVAQWTPRRPTYAAASDVPMSESEVASVIELIPKILWPPKIAGLAIAQRRFRDGYERYAADDPERLLEFTIALEAILLNDQDGTNELQFRTQLRAARLIGKEFSERNEVMNSVRDLYFIRSKFAHGASIDTSKSSEKRKLTTALEHGPRILRLTLSKMLLGEGPSDLEGDNLRLWWRNLELS